MNTDRDSKDSATQRAYLILTEVQPAYEPAVVERCRFDVRVHGVQQLETTATSTRAHVQQFAVASTTETTLSDMSCVRTPSWNRPQPRRSPTKTSRWCVGSFFELPLSDVTVVDGEKAVLERRVAVAPAAEVTWYVDTSFTVRGLRAGTDYYFRVIAENGASQPLALDRSFVPRTPYDKPSAPRGPLEVSGVTRSRVTLS